MFSKSCFLELVLEFMLHQGKYEFWNLQPSRNPPSQGVGVEEKHISSREKIYGHFPSDVQEGKLPGDVDSGEDSARLSTDLRVRQKMSHTEPWEQSGVLSYLSRYWTLIGPDLSSWLLICQLSHAIKTQLKARVISCHSLCLYGII